MVKFSLKIEVIHANSRTGFEQETEHILTSL